MRVVRDEIIDRKSTSCRNWVTSWSHFAKSIPSLYPAAVRSRESRSPRQDGSTVRFRISSRLRPRTTELSLRDLLTLIIHPLFSGLISCFCGYWLLYCMSFVKACVLSSRSDIVYELNIMLKIYNGLSYLRPHFCSIVVSSSNYKQVSQFVNKHCTTL